ncbi:uncharacterized protein BO80DRAFT_2129 [Aspergillus ibericus CBS 121593]|uniref:Uncharacterized protein n=1 Tax=Aspergillus ibericus CBS 121593 TaxID=1448316 RepID=A0A395HF57_9EURO|nr:hypothetical protein BO80DRAFT_2129 [Aspergillus ibericus CBS 121593]RAL06139.1 hypothetical protein BO80DRAFT_2129 [Aspergillus ibericus CBS 121593]
MGHLLAAGWILSAPAGIPTVYLLLDHLVVLSVGVSPKSSHPSSSFPGTTGRRTDGSGSWSLFFFYLFIFFFALSPHLSSPHFCFFYPLALALAFIFITRISRCSADWYIAQGLLEVGTWNMMLWSPTWHARETNDLMDLFFCNLDSCVSLRT